MFVPAAVAVNAVAVEPWQYETGVETVGALGEAFTFKVTPVLEELEQPVVVFWAAA